MEDMEKETRSLNEEARGRQSGEPISGIVKPIMDYKEILTDAKVPPEDIERSCEDVKRLLGETGMPGSRARKQYFLNTVNSVTGKS